MSLPTADELVNHLKQNPVFDKWKKEITDAFEKTEGDKLREHLKSLIESSQVLTSNKVGVTRDSSGKLFPQTIILKKLRDDVYNRLKVNEQIEQHISTILRHHRLEETSEKTQLMKEIRESISQACKQVRTDKLEKERKQSEQQNEAKKRKSESIAEILRETGAEDTLLKKPKLENNQPINESNTSLESTKAIDSLTNSLSTKSIDSSNMKIDKPDSKENTLPPKIKIESKTVKNPQLSKLNPKTESKIIKPEQKASKPIESLLKSKDRESSSSSSESSSSDTSSSSSDSDSSSSSSSDSSSDSSSSDKESAPKKTKVKKIKKPKVPVENQPSSDSTVDNSAISVSEPKKSRHGRVIKPSSKILEAEGALDEEFVQKKIKKLKKREILKEGEIAKPKHKKEKRIKLNKKLLAPLLQNIKVSCGGNSGAIKEGFILCDCCTQSFSPVDFEFHATGARTYNPMITIMVDEASVNLLEYCKLKEVEAVKDISSDVSMENITTLSKRRRKYENAESSENSIANPEKSPKSLSSRRKRREKSETQQEEVTSPTAAEQVEAFDTSKEEKTEVVS